MEVAGDVGAQGFIELVVGEILDRRTVLLEGGVVDEDIQSPPFVHHAADRRLAEVR